MKVGFVVLILSFFLGSYVHAAKIAFIARERATIYANPNGTSPIGYATKGKKVLIGDRLRYNGTIVSIYVANRAAFIYYRDVILENQKQKSFTRNNNQRQKSKNRTIIKTDNNFKHTIEFSYHMIGLDNQWKEFSTSLSDTASGSMYAYKLAYHSKPNFFRWSAGASMYWISQDYISLSCYTLEASGYLKVLDFNSFAFEIFATLIGSPYFMANFVVSNTIYEIPGYGFGYSAGGQLKFFQGKKFNLILGADIKSLALTTAEVSEIISFNGVSGFNIFTGLTFNF